MGALAVDCVADYLTVVVAGLRVEDREESPEVSVVADPVAHLLILPDRNVPSLEVSAEQVHRT